MKSQNMKPKEIVAVLLSIYIVLAVIMYVFPKDGIALAGDFKLQFVSSDEFFNSNKEAKADISNILAQSEVFQKEAGHLGEAPVEDTLSTIDGEQVKKAFQDTIKPTLFKLQFPKEGSNVLHRFWKKMSKARQNNKLLRIMHYGDSQIEADRITSFLRNKLQREFGGSGPGMRPLKQAFDYKAPIRQKNDGEWLRYPVYGRRDTTLTHRRYGVLTAFSRFSPHEKKKYIVPIDTLSAKIDSITPKNDSIAPKAIVEEVAKTDTMFNKEYTASVNFSKSNVSYFSARKFRKVRLFYGFNKRPFYLEASNDEVVISQDSIDVNSSLQIKTWKLDDYTDNFNVKFAGKHSPELYGIALDDKQGIAVDNIAMRGSSGTTFRRIDAKLMKAMYNELNVGMLILQFGGNVTPYVKENYDFYERRFYKQLLRFKTLMPNVAIIVIGPADMSRKEKDQYVSYQNIPLIRDALRSATFRAGGAFWDMYEAMGGENSMPSWVNHQPPLAAKDFIHFNHKGARVIAEMFYKAFIEEYRQYQRLSANQ